VIIRELKLKLTYKQEKELDRWLFHLTSVYNWGLRKIELNADNKIYFNKFDFYNLLSNHSKIMSIPSHVMSAVLLQSWTAWQRCFKKISRKPYFKGRRNKFISIPFPDTIKTIGTKEVRLVGIGKVRFFKQDIPEGKIKCGRIIKRSSGWYLLIWIDAVHTFDVKQDAPAVGIDTGFSSLLTLSDGTKIENPRELRKGAERLAQAQRGRRWQTAKRIQERQANRRKDRNHKISTFLVKNYSTIYITDDNLKGQQKKFGKSINEASIGNLIAMVSYKSAVHAGRKYVAVSNYKSTMTCNVCGKVNESLRGVAGLSVRFWECDRNIGGCGTVHDRDVNSARFTLKVGAGCALKALATEQLTGMSV